MGVDIAPFTHAPFGFTKLEIFSESFSPRQNRAASDCKCVRAWKKCHRSAYERDTLKTLDSKQQYAFRLSAINEI